MTNFEFPGGRPEDVAWAQWWESVKVGELCRAGGAKGRIASLDDDGLGAVCRVESTGERLHFEAHEIEPWEQGPSGIQCPQCGYGGGGCPTSGYCSWCCGCPGCSGARLSGRSRDFSEVKK